MLRSLMNSQLVRFLIVGGSATAFQFVLLIALVEGAKVDKVLASFSSYIVSAAFNYLLNYYLTFASKVGHLQALPKFVVVVAIGSLVNTLVFAGALHVVPYLIAQCAAIFAALCSNFLLHKYWIYRGDQ